jgi:Domain of unknown function (DUF5668)/Cell wall-active antibiotics response 4TMS YvqF
MPNDTRLKVTPQLAVGICLTLFGVLLTLDRLHVVAASESLRMWPALLIILGTSLFVHGRDARSRVRGLVLIFIGAWLLLNVLGVLRAGFWELFWPFAIILLGARLIMQTLAPASPTGEWGDPATIVRRAIGRRSRWADRWSTPLSEETQGTAPSLQRDGGTVSLFAVLGHSTRTSSDKRFRGGEMTAFMGGCQLDLRQAAIAPGEEAIINVLAMMGGHEIAVPPAWTVASEVIPLLGGVEDKRLPPIEATPPAVGEARPRLVIRGVVVMGGLTIKS